MAGNGGDVVEPVAPLQDSDRRELHSRGFNPFEMEENCFYVALGRMLAIASIDVARIAGRSEFDTTGLGMDFGSKSYCSVILS